MCRLATPFLMIRQDEFRWMKNGDPRRIEVPMSWELGSDHPHNDGGGDSGKQGKWPNTT